MPDRIGGELLKGHLPSLVLATLVDKPRHGYEIMHILGDRSGGIFDMGQGTVYPLLYGLEEQGLIHSRDQVVEGRRRRIYTLTRSGRKSLDEQRQTWRLFQKAINRVFDESLGTGRPRTRLLPGAQP